MEKKFTQGEWKHVNDSPYHRVELVNGRLYVASVEGALNESEEQANAKLIAAAPIMYEAISSALRIVDLWIPPDSESHNEETQGEVEALMNMKNAFESAINKATT